MISIFFLIYLNLFSAHCFPLYVLFKKILDKIFRIVTSPGFKRRFGLKRVKQGLIAVLCASKIFCSQVTKELPNISKLVYFIIHFHILLIVYIFQY